MVTSIILLARWSLSKSNAVALFYLQDLNIIYIKYYIIESV